VGHAHCLPIYIEKRQFPLLANTLNRDRKTVKPGTECGLSRQSGWLSILIHVNVHDGFLLDALAGCIHLITNDLPGLMFTSDWLAH
jgi:hypothetical protein